jgi:hypothetical protein
MSSFTRFYDMPGNIRIENGIVHIDMFDKKPGDDKEQVYAFSERIALSVQGFMRMYEMMSQVVSKLEEQGVLTRSKPAAKEDADKAE